jgi:hypothetical protein
MAKFEILRRGSRQTNISLVLPAAAALEGIAFQESATAGTAELADSTKPFAGFVTRVVLTELPTPSIAELTGQGAQPLETGFIAGYEGAFEDADEFVAEGGDYLYSGTGMLVTGTALKTKCAFKDGKARIAQSGEYAEFMLVEKQTPETSGNLRMRFARISGVIV